MGLILPSWVMRRGITEQNTSSESLASQSANGINHDEESLSDSNPGDEYIDFPVGDRHTCDEGHFIICRNQSMQYEGKLDDKNLWYA